MLSNVPLNEVVVKTFSDLIGYLWCFPRSDHVCIGIITRMVGCSVPDLLKRVDEFINTNYHKAQKINRWVAHIPFISNPAFWEIPCSGKNWALIGDAAGHVSAAIGEGIPYALKSAELVAQAILHNNLENFNRDWRAEYGNWLLKSSKIIHALIKSGNIKNFEQIVQYLFSGDMDSASQFVNLGN